jgi:prepilin-type N-terminal cleavage/methylation domain-containing protein
MNSNLPRRVARGFTLVEMMVAMTIVGIVSAGAIRFLIHGLNIYAYDSGRLRINKDIRSFTDEMTTNCVYSNYFRIYPNFSTRSTTSASVTTDAALHDGQSGDFLVLVFADTDPATGRTTVNRLVGYYRDPDDPASATSTGPVRKFDKVISPAVDPAVTPIYTILNDNVANSTAHTNPAVLQLAQGLANGTLFYDYYDRSVMVKGQIIETMSGTHGDVNRRAINTYNFTVSPRG